MEGTPVDSEVRQALYELQQFLSDRLPPLTVADSVELLFRQPPSLVANEIHAWINAQYRGKGPSFPIVDYLYHSIRKIHLIGELRLIEPEVIARYIEFIKPHLLDLCPPADREQLLSNLDMMSVESDTSSITPQAENIYRPGGDRPTGARGEGEVSSGPMSEETARNMRRFALLLERLKTTSDFGEAAGESSEAVPFRAAAQKIAAQAIATAAAESSNSDEFDEYLRRIRGAGIDTAPSKVFRVLGESLPPWPVPQLSEEERAEFPPSFGAGSPVEAMHKMVTMASSPREGSKRFYEMVAAAVEQFNTGALSRAVTMFELAERIAAEKSLDEAEVRTVRSTLFESFDPDQLRKYTDRKEKHALLRRVLAFFPAFAPERLLEDLRDEQRRERRRWLLALLEVHGPGARAVAVALASKLAADKAADPFFLRNVLYLVNRIQRPNEEGVDEEVDLLAGLTSPQNSPIVVKEALAGLATLRSDRAERVILSRMTAYENSLLDPGSAGRDLQETRQLLDRCIAILSRFGTSSALLAVVEHGLRVDERLGDTRGRLAGLSGVDLSEFPDVMKRLVDAVRAELPRKVLGFIVKKRQTPLVRMIEALSGTPSAEVRTLFEEILERYPDQDFARAVQQALSGFGATPKAISTAATPSLAGDLEVFGLPNLFQTLADSQVTGILNVYDQDGGAPSTIVFESGMITRCSNGTIEGREAVFKLFERAAPGTFTFYTAKESAEGGQDGASPIKVTPVVFEAVVRYEELARTKMIVPENAVLLPTGTKPAPHPEESDPKLVRDVWLRASSGARPSEWESQLPASSYRVYRLLAHWVETGALSVKTAA